MGVHVDVLRNDWLGGEQHPIARIYFAQGGLQIDSPDPARWTAVVEGILDGLDQTDSPEERLPRVPELFQGSHLVATPVHDDSACAFRGWASVRIQSVSRDREAAATGA